MNGKRARALNRVRAGQATLEDIQRLRRTEIRPGPEPKQVSRARAGRVTSLLPTTSGLP